jgi:hypothetical protein
MRAWRRGRKEEGQRMGTDIRHGNDAYPESEPKNENADFVMDFSTPCPLPPLVAPSLLEDEVADENGEGEKREVEDRDMTDEGRRRERGEPTCA